MTSALAAPSTEDCLVLESEAGPSRISVADKWVKPNGPPVGSTFGARLLGADEDLWGHNAWDHVEPPADFYERAEAIMLQHRATPVPSDKRGDYNNRPAEYWNAFYAKSKDAFFKDRGWLRLEFPELIACSEADAGPKIVLEVGCGAGNTVFPLLMRNENGQLVVHATDYSKQAIEVVKANPMYPSPPHGMGVLHASVWDITSRPSASPGDSRHAADYCLPEGMEPGTVDVITVIFVLSALHPDEWEQAMHNLYMALRPGGLLLIRDYGRNDLAQLRIKKDRLLDPDVPHHYIRGDGTRVYFFTEEELRELVAGGSRRHGRNAGIKECLARLEHSTEETHAGRYEVLQLGEDRRLLINRKEKLKMYRIWMQLKARKLGPGDVASEAAQSA